VIYLGDFAEDATLHFKWSSYDSSGASVTRATNGTVSVYVGSSTTQLTTGVTDTEDFDSLTGIHHCTIDLSSSATYATGSECQVVLSAATIDGNTVNAVLAHFSIERSGGAIELATGANGFAAIKAQTAAIETDTQDLQSQIGTAGAGLTNLGGMSTGMKAEVNAEADTAISDASLATAASIAALNDLSAAAVNAECDTAIADAALATAASIAALNDLSAAEVNAEADTAIADAALATAANLANLTSGIIFGAAATGTLSTTQATTDLTGYADDQLIGRVIIWLTGDCAGEATDITDYANSSGLLTFTDLTTAPANGDTFKVV
jgi:hypothetical protein